MNSMAFVSIGVSHHNRRSISVCYEIAVTDTGLCKALRGVLCGILSYAEELLSFSSAARRYIFCKCNPDQ